MSAPGLDVPICAEECSVNGWSGVMVTGGVRTEIKGHAEVGQTCCGQDDYRNLVEETDASRPLEAAYADDGQLGASHRRMSFIRDGGGGLKETHHQVESDNGEQREQHAGKAHPEPVVSVHGEVEADVQETGVCVGRCVVTGHCGRSGPWRRGIETSGGRKGGLAQEGGGGWGRRGGRWREEGRGGKMEWILGWVLYGVDEGHKYNRTSARASTGSIGRRASRPQDD